MILSILQILVFTTYIIFILRKQGGIPSSISSSWYFLPSGKKWLFTMFCWGIAIPMVAQGGLLFVASAIGMGFTGVAVNYKGTLWMVPYIHYTGATICIFFALAGLYFEYGLIAPALIFIVSSLLHIIGNHLYPETMKNPVWWVEIYAFLTISIGLLVK